MEEAEPGAYRPRRNPAPRLPHAGGDGDARARPSRAAGARREADPRAHDAGPLPRGRDRPAPPPPHQRAAPGEDPRGEADRGEVRPLARLTQNEKLAATLTRREGADRGAARGGREALASRRRPSACTCGANEDGSVDVFTAGRKMRVNVVPRRRPGRARQGRRGDPQRGAQRRRGPRRPIGPGEVMKVKDRLGERPRGRGRPRRRGARRDPRGRPARRADPGGRPAADRSAAPTSRSRSSRRRRSRSSSSRRSPTSPTRTSGASRGRSRRSATRWSCRSSTRSCSPSTSSSPRRGSCSTGRPGCGKTLIAKAVAKSLADKVRERTGREDAHSYFLNIKGPELLNKYVGETERQIRQIFQRAKERSEEGLPVIVFFDEMDSIFRTRGTGISSDVESTIVPQLLSELDGVETLKNVIVIGASQPRGPDRPGDPATRAARREDQDRAARTAAGRRHHEQVPERQRADPPRGRRSRRRGRSARRRRG